MARGIAIPDSHSFPETHIYFSPGKPPLASYIRNYMSLQLHGLHTFICAMNLANLYS